MHEASEHLLVVEHEAERRTRNLGTVPAGRPEGRAAFGRAHAEGVGAGLVVGIEPVALGDGRHVDEEVQVVVHDRERPDLDAAEGGDGYDPFEYLVLDDVFREEHRAVGDAGGDVVDAVVDGHAVLSCHRCCPFVASRPRARGNCAAGTVPPPDKGHYGKKEEKKTLDNLEIISRFLKTSRDKIYTEGAANGGTVPVCLSAYCACAAVSRKS